MYSMLGTKPELAFAVALLSPLSSNLGQPHWDAISSICFMTLSIVLRQFCAIAALLNALVPRYRRQHISANIEHVLRYMRGTADYRLTYGDPVGASPLTDGYCDSDWGSNQDDGRTVTGYTFMLEGGAVSWQSKKQPTVALSSVAAEYIAACQAAREALWWQKLLHELGVARHPTTVIYSDSQGSIALSKNPEHHARSKHIDIRHHFIREQVAANRISLQYMPT